jgi:hypothetical protein
MRESRFQRRESVLERDRRQLARRASESPRAERSAIVACGVGVESETSIWAREGSLILRKKEELRMTKDG